ncbi:MAG: hypothetical protein CMD23_03300 [Flavobacteriales bacterium]|nr:hypothetical protein [Flavobacteriales bacterium]
MFQAPFSFKGRIRRLEFGITFIIISIWNMIIRIGYYEEWMLFLTIPLMWFQWAQGAKRCHDRNCSGWWQLVPFYALWMLFAEGTRGPNKYGPDPKNPHLTSETTYDEMNTESAMGSETQNNDINFE